MKEINMMKGPRQGTFVPLWVIGIILISIIPGYGQDTRLRTYEHYAFEEGMNLFNEGLYLVAREKLLRYLDQETQIAVQNCPSCLTRARLMVAESSIYVNDPDAAMILERIISEIRPDPLVDQALINIANYYHNKSEHNKALTYYKQIDQSSLDRQKRSEVQFKMAYSYFMLEEYSRARELLSTNSDPGTPYFYPSQYYYALSNYYLEDYNEAISGLEKIHESAMYRDQVPYYMSQIMVMQGREKDLIRYLEPQLGERKLRQEDELYLMLGQAYFRQNDFEKARIYLGEYESRVLKMPSEVFYQLGEAAFRTGHYEQAIESFLNLSNEGGEMGQISLYKLAGCYIKTDQPESARSAFLQSSKIEGNPKIRQDALFQYGKLSVESNFPTEAVKALRAIERNDPNFDEAQKLMADVLSESRNYDESLQILETMNKSTPEIRRAYQKVNYLKAVDRFNAQEWTTADRFFSRSLEEPIDQTIRAKALFWKGELAQIAGKPDLSNQYFQEFITASLNLQGLPEECSLETAYYAMGYNYLKLQQYAQAQGFFQKAIIRIKERAYTYSSPIIPDQILADATLRTADCMFKRNDYPGALRFYGEAISKVYPGHVYASYQKGLIEGLQEKYAEKLITLESLVEKNPDHELADDALFQIGTTYQQMNRFTEAREAFSALVDKYSGGSPLTTDALIKMGLISYNQGDVYRSLQYYKKVFEYNPDQTTRQEALLAIQEIYIQDLNQPEEYVDFMESIPGYRIDQAGRDSISFMAANSPYVSGNYEKAIQALSDYLKRFPQGIFYLEALFKRGDAHLFLKNYSDALADFEKIVAAGMNPYFEKSSRNAAIIHYDHLERFDRALYYFQQFLTSASSEENNLEALIGCMKSAFKSGQNNLMAEYIQKVLDHPRSSLTDKASAYFYSGKYAFDQREYAKAVKAFNEVTRLSDNVLTAEARYLIAYIYFINKELDLASRLCQQAIRESGAYPHWVARCLLLNADIKMELGDLFDARASVEAVLENYLVESDDIRKIAAEKLEVIKKMEHESSRIRD